MGAPVQKDSTRQGFYSPGRDTRDRNIFKDSVVLTRGQGCPLRSILFNLYINDIFDIMSNNIESNIFLKDGEKMNMLMYADGSILLSVSKEGLQKQINKLYNYCKQWN